MSITPDILFRGTTEKELEDWVYDTEIKRILSESLVKRFTSNSKRALVNALEYSKAQSSGPRIIILLNPADYEPIQDEISDNYFDIDLAKHPIDLRDPEVKLLDRENIEDIVSYFSRHLQPSDIYAGNNLYLFKGADWWKENTKIGL